MLPENNSEKKSEAYAKSEQEEKSEF